MATRLGVLGVLREVFGIPLRNPRLTAAVLLLLLPCNLILLVPTLALRLEVNIRVPLPNRSPLGEEPITGESRGVALAEPGGPPPAEAQRIRRYHIAVSPLGYIVRRLSMLALVYLSAMTCKGKHSTLGALLSKVQRSWRKVAVSFLYGQLFLLTYTCLFLMLAEALNLILETDNLVLLLVLLSLFSTFCFGFLIFLYLVIACHVSPLISAVEEDKGGLAALGRAVSLIRGRKLLGLVLVASCTALHRILPANNEKMVGGAVFLWRFAGVVVDLLVELFVWLLWTVYYYECKKSRGLVGKGERVLDDEGQSLITRSCNTVDSNLI